MNTYLFEHVFNKKKKFRVQKMNKFLYLKHKIGVFLCIPWTKIWCCEKKVTWIAKNFVEFAYL